MTLHDDARELQAFIAGLSETDDQANALSILAEAAGSLADLVDTLLSEPTNVQALALARLMRDRPGAQVVVHRDVFDLPNGYWLAVIGLDGFQCGIAPDGSVSS
jgi:hypothetical protein